jgi:dihydroflavonol-4-reductase
VIVSVDDAGEFNQIRASGNGGGDASALPDARLFRIAARVAEDGPVVVTGVAGFVGAAVARAAAAAGWPVRGIVRASSTRRNLADFPGELVTADLRDAEAVTRALAGARHLIHVAADYRLWARDPEEIVRNNRDTTAVVMHAALAAGIERIVHTSSVATLLPDPAGPADETRAAAPHEVVGAYKRSKVVAERLVERLVADAGLPAVIVNPSTPIGPRDARPTPTGRIIVEAASGRMPAFVDSGLNLVHVDDVAQGHLAALTRGRIGERYILGGEDVTLAALLAEIAARTGRRAPTISLPRAPLVPLAWANEKLATLTGREPFLTLDGLRMSKHRMFYSSSKAVRELGYRARPWQAAVADALAWFRTEGMVR